MSTDIPTCLSLYGTLPRSLFHLHCHIALQQPPPDFHPLIVPSGLQPDLLNISSIFPPPCSFVTIPYEPTYHIAISSITLPAPSPLNEPPMMSIPPTEDGIRLPAVSAEGVSMEVCILSGKKGIWLEDGDLVDVIERKPDGDYEFMTIILSEMV